MVVTTQDIRLPPTKDSLDMHSSVDNSRKQSQAVDL
jgi:hypothetical protein